MNKKRNISNEIIPRDLSRLDSETGNIYETISIIARRANQLSKEQKEELHAKLAEFAPATDNLEEVFENREQIEISAYYERQTKPTLVATDEFLNGEIYFRNPFKDKAAEEEGAKKGVSE
jgi:DNA-directed RNA polymerase subunit K/omega